MLRQGLGGSVVCAQWNRVTRLQGAMTRLGYHLGKVLVREREGVRQEGCCKEES